MQLASIFAGIAISHTKTGLSHSISYPLTSIYNIPHGIASSLVLPELLLFNSSNDDGRFSELCINLKFSSVNEFYQELLSIRSDLLRGLDIVETIKKIKIEDIAHKIITPERAKLNIKEVSHVEASEILKRAIKNI
jgi:alcohol dehydrogenase class IV